jgi:hypothetical protein
MLAVSWASESGCAVSRRAQSDGGGSQNSKSYQRIDLLGVRKPMEPTFALCKSEYGTDYDGSDRDPVEA